MSQVPDSPNPGGRKIQPTDVPLSHAVAETSDNQIAPWYQSRLTVIGLVASVLLALLVIFVLPALVKPVDAPAVAVEVNKPLPTQALESPWQEAQLAKARRESQDILNQVLEKQQFLELRNVLLWDKDNFESVMVVAAEGDVAYRQREFAEALSAYSQALEGLTAIEAKIPTFIASTLQAGQSFLDQGDSRKAAEEFNRVLAIEPNNDTATKGLARSENLDQVLEWVEQANQFIEAGQLDDALASFSKAVALDDQWSAATEGKQQTQALILEREFNQSMGEGFTRLQQGALRKAEQAFVAALKLRPNDGAAKQALIQVRNRIAQQKLNALLADASAAETAEQWQQAMNVYQKILADDSSVIEAKVGTLRTSARAKLDAAIEKLLGNPMRLATPAVFAQGQNILRDARGINSPGPRLQQQIVALNNALIKASTPIPVQLVSDNRTQVNVFKVGELGSFNNKQLSLKPGRYVATGVRSGYRDVRIEFQVTGDPLEPVEVICSEPV